MSVIRVLVADDADDVRALVRMLLDVEDDFEVVAEASTGDEAVRLAREFQPDVIVLDVSMPVLDGIAAISGLRAAAPNAKIVMFSAYDSATTMEKALERGAAGFVVKGGGVVDLVGQLREIVLPA